MTPQTLKSDKRDKMPQEIVITPYLATEQLPVLKRWVNELDHALEKPAGSPADCPDRTPRTNRGHVVDCRWVERG